MFNKRAVSDLIIEFSVSDSICKTNGFRRTGVASQKETNIQRIYSKKCNFEHTEKLEIAPLSFHLNARLGISSTDLFNGESRNISRFVFKGNGNCSGQL